MPSKTIASILPENSSNAAEYNAMNTLSMVTADWFKEVWHTLCQLPAGNIVHQFRRGWKEFRD
jgi:hypothetical protein